MKGLVFAGVASLALVLGCAPVSYTRADIDGRVVCNADAMGEIERNAQKRFASVHWVNCPKITLRVVG